MASMAYQLTTQLLAGKRPRIFVDGEQARDQVYVDDVVDCTIAAAGISAAEGEAGVGDPPVPGVYNVGSGVATSFNAVVLALRNALGLSESDRPIEYFDMPPDVRRFYQDYTCADIGPTAVGLHWRPRHRPAEAMGAYARWLRTRSGS
jgi:ADP-L-glycero-D-manno-heptose 6-epimerase